MTTAGIDEIDSTEYVGELDAEKDGVHNSTVRLEFSMFCKDADIPTCMVSELKHFPTKPRASSNMYVAMLYGKPHGCPSGKDSLEFHEWVAKCRIGVGVSQLLDASKLRFFKSFSGNGFLDPADDFTNIPSIRSNVLEIILNGKDTHDLYSSYYSRFGYRSLWSSSDELEKYQESARYIKALTLDRLLPQIDVMRPGRVGNKTIQILKRVVADHSLSSSSVTLSAIIQNLHHRWTSAVSDESMPLDYRIMVARAAMGDLGDAVTLVKNLFAKISHQVYGHALQHGCELATHLSRVERYHYMQKDI